MHRGVLAVTVVGLCSSALLGCSSDTPQADPTSSPPTSSISTTSAPTTTPPTTPSAPPKTSTPPPLARQETVAGSKAFVRFYISAINASWHTRSGAIPRKFSTPGCISCRGLASSMDKIRHDDGLYRGGDWIVTSTTPIPLQTRNRPIVHTAVTVKPGAWKRSPSDHLRRIEAGKMYVDVHLVWSDATWLVTSMVLA